MKMTKTKKILLSSDNNVKQSQLLNTWCVETMQLL